MRWYHTAAALVLAAALAVPAAAGTFSHVPEEHWARPYIEKMSEEGIVRGIGGGEFGFLAAENGALESLRYCVYRDVPGEGVSGESEMGELDIFPLFRNGKGE